jgi:hypothetical protein
MSRDRYIIYALKDPSGAVRYIGKSSAGLKVAQRHITARVLSKDTSRKGDWIRSLMARGERPEIEVMEVLHEGGEALSAAEKRWIAEARTSGLDLTNMQAGGVGASAGMRHRSETKRRQSDAAKRRLSSPEGRQHLEQMRAGAKAARAARARLISPGLAMAWLEAVNGA